MKIRMTNIFEPHQLEEVHELIRSCWAHDKTCRLPYLANTFNADPDWPCFYLGYSDEGNLLAVLAAYADEPNKPELSLYVHPDYRRQGYATVIYQKFCQDNTKLIFERQTFVSEKAFLEKAPDFLEAWGLEEAGESEFLMKTSILPEVKRPAGLVVTLASEADLPQITALKMQAFDESEEVAGLYVQQALADQQVRLYILKQDEEVLASVSVDLSTEDNYLFGVETHADYRGQGLATALVTQVMALLQAENGRPFELAVERTNHPARCFYEKLGFAYQTEVIYLDKK